MTSESGILDALAGAPDRAAVVGVRQLRDAVQGVRPARRARATRTRRSPTPPQVHRYTGVAPTVALHIPWDKVDDYADLARHAADCGVALGHHQLEHVPGRRLHARQRLPPGSAGPAARPIDHLLECVDIMDATGSRDLKLWFADGTNYPGQDDIRARQDRLAESLETVYATARRRTSGWCSSTSCSSPPSTRPTSPTGAPRSCTACALGDQALVVRRHRPPRAGHEHRVHRRVAAAGRASSARSTSTRASTPTTT